MIDAKNSKELIRILIVIAILSIILIFISILVFSSDSPQDIDQNVEEPSPTVEEENFVNPNSGEEDALRENEQVFEENLRIYEDELGNTVIENLDPARSINEEFIIELGYDPNEVTVYKPSAGYERPNDNEVTEQELTPENGYGDGDFFLDETP